MTRAKDIADLRVLLANSLALGLEVSSIRDVRRLAGDIADATGETRVAVLDRAYRDAVALLLRELNR